MTRSATVHPRVARTARLGLALSLAAGLLAGCGAGSDGSGSDPAATAPTSAPAAAPSTEAAAGGGTGKVSAQEFCDQLKKTQPKLDEIGTRVGAIAQLTVDLATLYEDKGAMDELADAPMDQLVAQGCPAAGAAALKSAGVKSFDNL